MDEEDGRLRRVGGRGDERVVGVPGADLDVFVRAGIHWVDVRDVRGVRANSRIAMLAESVTESSMGSRAEVCGRYGRCRWIYEHGRSAERTVFEDPRRLCPLRDQCRAGGGHSL